MYLHSISLWFNHFYSRSKTSTGTFEGNRRWEEADRHLFRLLIWILMLDSWVNFIFIYCLHHIIRTWSFFHWHDSYKHWKSKSHGSNSGQYDSFHVHLPKGSDLFLQDIWTWGSIAKDISSAWHKSQTSSPRSSTVTDGEPRLKM